LNCQYDTYHLTLLHMVLKIKSYQEDVTYVTCNVPSFLTESEMIDLGRGLKKVIDNIPRLNGFDGTPNVIRFEDSTGRYDSRLKKIVEYR
jgi:hypothetical protein